MNRLLNILSLLLALSACEQVGNKSNKDLTVMVISNQLCIQPIDLSLLVNDDAKTTDIGKLNAELKAISGEEIIESIELTDDSKIAIKTTQAGIARYTLVLSGKEIHKKTIDLCIVSQFLLDFTQNRPIEPGGSLKGIPYPESDLVQEAEEITGVDKDGARVRTSPGLLVNKELAPYPHNSREDFPDFVEAIKYYGYKENGNEFYFRYQPLIPMLEVGNGEKNRGVGIIVINKNHLMDDPEIEFEFEGYCSIRTRSDAKETYNLGVVIGTMNKNKASFKDAVVARDYFNIGYSSSGQIYSEKFKLEKDDHITISIVGEAGLGGDKKRTIRFEYIKISPVLD